MACLLSFGMQNNQVFVALLILAFLTMWRKVNRTKVVTFLKQNNQIQFTFLTDVLSRSKKEIAKIKLFSWICWVLFWLSCWVFLPEVHYLFPLKSKNFFLKLKTNHLLFKKNYQYVCQSYINFAEGCEL